MAFRLPKTYGLASTRARLGLSQSEFAKQLGIPKGTISMAETGRRNLPVKALLKLAELELKMAAAANTTTDPGIEKEKEEQSLRACSDLIASRELECHFEILILTHKLNLMTEQYEKLLPQLELVKNMIKKEVDAPDNEFLNNLKYKEMRLECRLSQCAPAEQIMLRTKIALRSAESLVGKSVMQQLTNPKTTITQPEKQVTKQDLKVSSYIQ